MKTAHTPFALLKLSLRALCLLLPLLALAPIAPEPLLAAPVAPLDEDEGSAGSGPWSNYSPADGLASPSILSVLSGSDGELWVGNTGGASVLQADGTWKTFTDANGLAGNIVTDFAPVPGNPQQRWFGAYGGLALLDTGGSLTDPDGHQWVRFTKADGLVEDWVSAVAVDAGGKVWIGTYFIESNGDDNGFGVSRLDTNQTPFDKSDDTWTTFTQATGTLSNNIVRDIQVDDDGVVWIATASGLNAVYDSGWAVYYTTDGLPSNDITGLAVHNGLLWIATKGGIAVMDDRGTPGLKSDDQVAAFSRGSSGLVDNETSSISVDDRGQVWVGTARKTSQGEAGSGISVLAFNGTAFNRADDQWATFTASNGLAQDAVRSLTPWGNAQMAIGTRGGLSIFKYGQSPFSSRDDKWQTYTAAGRLSGSLVGAVADGGFGAVWLGTEQGLNLLRYGTTPHQKSDDVWLMYTPSGGATIGAIQSLVVDQRGWLWIGSSNGLWIIDTKRTLARTDDDVVKQYKADAGLVHNNINDVAIDKAGRAWLAGGDYFSGGLQVLDPGTSLSSGSDDIWATFTSFNSSLPGSNVTSVAIDNADSAWVGTTTGAARLQYGTSPFTTADDRWTVFRAGSSGLAYDSVRDVLVDQSGNTWFGLLINGVSVRAGDGSWQTFTQGDGLTYDSIYALARDTAGRIWIGTDGGGASVLDYRNSIGNKSDDLWLTYAGGQPMLSGNVRAISVDLWGQVWIGTFGGGATVYSEAQLSQLFLPAIRRR
jgi:ligand-binding sensor domain-containing protein